MKYTDISLKFFITILIFIGNLPARFLSPMHLPSICERDLHNTDFTQFCVDEIFPHRINFRILLCEKLNSFFNLSYTSKERSWCSQKLHNFPSQSGLLSWRAYNIFMNSTKLHCWQFKQRSSDFTENVNLWDLQNFDVIPDNNVQ